MTTTHVTEHELLDLDRAAELLTAVQRGEKGAIEDLVRLCEPLVRRHARRYAWRRQDIDDVVQDVWLRLLVNAGRIREPKALFAWIGVVTRRSAADLGHRESRLVPTPLEDDVAGADSTEDEAIHRHHGAEITDGVRTALGRLGRDERRLLLLLHRSDRPQYEVVSRKVCRPIGSLGPTRRRLLDRLRADRDLAGLATLRPAV
jgi:RNA polymerase sigma factor (sigma-70 family)